MTIEFKLSETTATMSLFEPECCKQKYINVIKVYCTSNYWALLMASVIRNLYKLSQILPNSQFIRSRFTKGISIDLLWGLHVLR